MGVAITASSHGGLVAPSLAYEGLWRLNDLFRVAREPAGAATLNFLSVGSTNFTPELLTTPEPQPNDRPYASLFFVGVGYQSQFSRALLVETELRLGLLGTNIGRWTQTKIHERCCKDDIPLGWDNQIGQGGSPTFLYHVRFLHPMVDEPTTRMQWTFGADAGYYVRAFSGLVWSWGRTPKDLDAIRLAGTTAVAAPMAPPPPDRFRATRSPARGGSRGMGAWLEFETSLMAYNELVQGAWSGTNRVTFPASRMKRLVHRASAGVDLAFIPKTLPWLEDKEFHLYYTQGFRSRDLEGTPHGSHAWGGLTLSFEL